MTELFRMSFTLKGLPKVTTNANSSWKARWVESRKWKTAVEEKVVFNRLAPPTPLKRAHLILTRYAFGREPDRDNLRSSFKHVVDGLVKVGVLEDDSPSVIGEPEVYWEKAKPKQGKITVQVWEVA